MDWRLLFGNARSAAYQKGLHGFLLVCRLWVYPALGVEPGGVVEVFRVMMQSI
jgi:hypothetical protein